MCMISGNVRAEICENTISEVFTDVSIDVTAFLLLSNIMDFGDFGQTLIVLYWSFKVFGMDDCPSNTTQSVPEDILVVKAVCVQSGSSLSSESHSASNRLILNLYPSFASAFCWTDVSLF